MAKDCCFTTDIPAASVLDPTKRVRYFTGQVLGEDEFRQDQLYLMARDEMHQRALHGYGRVSGLHVGERTTDGGGLEIVVGAGAAVNPKGETICVPQAQCADLDTWLENHRDDLLGSPPLALPGNVSLFIVLCARDCETDPVPVLGDPCRVLDEATAASRIADDFELCFRLEPPVHAEEQAIAELGVLLRSIEITEDAPGMSPETLAQLVRDTFLQASPPMGGGAGSPPEAFALHPDDAHAAYVAALTVWITEVRPTLNPETGVCEIPRDGDGGRCVLIGCLDVPFDDGPNGLAVSGTVTIDGACGPLLLSTRLLQELGLGALPAMGALSAPGLASPPVGEGGAPVDGAVIAAPLPQVVSTSWVHDNASLLRLRHDGGDAFGLALGFGLSDGSGPVAVDARTLTPRSVRLGLRQRDDAAPPGLDLMVHREIVAEEIVPVDVSTRSGQIVRTATSSTAGEATGVFFRMSDIAARTLLEGGFQLFVELVADHILALDGRPLASSFPRRTAPIGLAGHFESWVEAGRPRLVVDGVDINRDPATRLRTLPGIGNSLATRIVTEREGRGGFDQIDDLVGVSGVSAATVENLRSRLET